MKIARMAIKIEILGSLNAAQAALSYVRCDMLSEKNLPPDSYRDYQLANSFISTEEYTG